MPAMTSIAEFTRKPGEIIDRLHETQQPLYLTRNGKSSVVIEEHRNVNVFYTSSPARETHFEFTCLRRRLPKNSPDMPSTSEDVAR